MRTSPGSLPSFPKPCSLRLTCAQPYHSFLGEQEWIAISGFLSVTSWALAPGKAAHLADERVRSTARSREFPIPSAFPSLAFPCRAFLSGGLIIPISIFWGGSVDALIQELKVLQQIAT